MPVKGSKRVRRFEEGGSTDPYAGMSKAQKDWLGGADPTDPYILHRMRSAVPDSAKESKSTKPSDNFYETSSAEDIANASFVKPMAETKQTVVKTPNTIKINKTSTSTSKVSPSTSSNYEDQNDRRMKQVSPNNEDQNDRKFRQIKPESGYDRYEYYHTGQKKPATNDAPELDETAYKSNKPKLSTSDMKKTIGFDPNTPENLTPGGAALKGIKSLTSNLLKKKATRDAQEEAMSGGFTYADKLAKDAKAPPDLVNYLSNKGTQARDYILNKLPKNSAANKTRKFEESGAMPGEFNASEMRPGFKRGGKAKAFKQGGSVKSQPARTSASKRADGIATKGFTRACGGGYMKGKK